LYFLPSLFLHILQGVLIIRIIWGFRMFPLQVNLLYFVLLRREPVSVFFGLTHILRKYLWAMSAAFL
jgi:hypothetical protein